MVRLPENSGGCSRPRNVGIERARAPYVMFLDSDDVYERHACKNLLLAAERTGADVVAGKVVRIHLAKNRESPWAKKLFTGRAVYRGVRENPLLFFDPLSTNKIYRREFLDRNDIRFPEGVHYEDSLFSTKVYCQAETIAVIPNVVYYWRVVADAEEAEASITQRRYEFENFRDRIAVHRMMDDFLREHGSADLKVHKDFKFIRHDLKLYLTDLPERDEEYQRKFMQLAADYLATVSEETLAMVLPVERVCVNMIRRLDVAGTLSTVDYLRFGFKLSTDLVERDGRVYWSGKYLDTPEDRAAMDVTEMGFHRLPFDRLALHNLVTAVRLRRSVLHIEGRVVIPLARIQPDDDLELFVNVKSRAGGGTSRSRPVRDFSIEGDRLFYRTDIDLSAAVGELDQENPVWMVTRGGQRIWREEPLPPPSAGLRLWPALHRVTPLLVGAKTLSYAANMQAQRQARAAGYDDALFVRADDDAILEGPVWSFGWLEGDTLVFPPLEVGVLDSITRRLAADAMPVRTREATLADMAGTDGALLLSTVQEAQPVAEVAGAATWDPASAAVRDAIAAIRAVIADRVEDLD